VKAPSFGPCAETAAAVRSRGIYHTPASTITKATSQSSADRQASLYDNEAAGFGDTAQRSYSYDATRAFVAGSFIWAGFDYIGEPTTYSSVQSKSAYYGAIDTAGFPKDVYYFYKSRWITDPVVHILPHWNWAAGSMVTIYVRRRGARRASADRATIDADGQDLVFVTGDIQDANGAIVPSASNAVSFAVSGPGQLVGVDNGNPVDTASYKGTSQNAFSGKVLAIVRSTGTAGSVSVTATSAGLTSGTVTVSGQ
jgi:beta-galactosidase